MPIAATPVLRPVATPAADHAGGFVRSRSREIRLWIAPVGYVKCDRGWINADKQAQGGKENGDTRKSHLDTAVEAKRVCAVGT